MDKVYLTEIQPDGSFKAVDRLERTRPVQSSFSCPPQSISGGDTKPQELPPGANISAP